MNCALDRKRDDVSCFKIDELIEIVNNINKEKQRIKISKNMELMYPHKYKKYLVSEIEKILGKDQVGWLKYIRKEMSDIFLPLGDFKSKYEWLNTIHINEYMEQLARKFNDIVTLGAVPIDFWKINYDGVRNKLKDLDELVRNGKTRIIVVLNLDKHDMPGSHWVAVFIDLKKGLITYFDSYGMKPNRYVRNFLRYFYKYLKGKGIKVISEYNGTRNQYKNSECGMYSLNFVKMMSEGKSFKDIENTPIPDDLINSLRGRFFTLKKNI